MALVAGGSYVVSMDVIDWLLDSDPAIRWQVMRDLMDADPAAIAAERARVAHEGLGAAIFARQDPDGSWRRGDDPVWFPTLHTLRLLRATGVDPADPAVESAVIRLVEDERQAAGTWLLDGSHDDGLDVALTESVGEPSRWNTLRAMRVLRWYDESRLETARQP